MIDINLKQKILFELQKRNSLKQFHRKIKQGLVGMMTNEYFMQRPDVTTKMITDISDENRNPCFHAIVNTLSSILIQWVTDVVIDAILDTMEEIQKDINKTGN